MSKRSIYVADFETTTDPDDCRVWVWGISSLDDPGIMDWNKTIDTFIEYLHDQDSVCYFHNLKFDGHFIVDWLLKNGYTHRHDDSRQLKAGQFRTLISGMHKWYSVKVKWKSGKTTEFRDSLKKINMPVRAIAGAFNLEVSKGDIDYHAHRPIGYEPTEDELDYLGRDVAIVATALREVINSGMKRLTVASDSLAEYKKLVGHKYFDRMFPVLSGDVDSDIRKAYRGGFTYADERYMKRKLGAGIVLDVNSLYPYVMYDRILPYGEPVWHSGSVELTEHRPLSIFSVTFTAKLKDNHIPCIQIKGSSIFGSTEYLKEIPEPTTLMVTNVDWELYNDHYDIEVLSYGGGWSFLATTGMFKTYIDKWMGIKATSEGGKREIAKLHLNSLYGKFATNPNITGKLPVLEDDRVKFITGPEETRKPVYTAIGVFVTSWARDLTIRAAQANYGAFAYADTDSLHLIGDFPEGMSKTWEGEINGLRVHPTDLGAWKFEYAFREAWYVRAKAYMEKAMDGDSYHVAWAGLPQREQHRLTFDHLIDGNVIHGKLHPRSVPGGVVLEDVPYTLKM